MCLSVKIGAFFVVLYGLMTSVFILLELANRVSSVVVCISFQGFLNVSILSFQSVSDFAWLWTFFAFFLVTAAGIVYVSYLQFERSQHEAAIKAAQKEAVANPL
jgi:hypothetical protein